MTETEMIKTTTTRLLQEALHFPLIATSQHGGPMEPDWVCDIHASYLQSQGIVTLLLR